LWVGQSVLRLCCWLDSHYNDVAVSWTVCTASVLWFGKSEQQLCCRLDIQYSDCYVGWTVIIVMVL